MSEKERVKIAISQNGYENRCYQEDNAQITDNAKHDYIQNAGNAAIRDSNTKNKISASSKSLEISSTRKDEWGGKYEFLMSCIATSVGLGNVWRFPFTAYENGGGAFLIPYIIVLFVIGKPFYFMEGILGQFTSRSCSETWKMVPAMKGIGFSHVFAGFTVLTYYCALMALTVYYFVASFQTVLPWSYCRVEWENECLNVTNTVNVTMRNSSTKIMSSAELYFRRVVLDELDSIENGIGLPSVYLMICLFISWTCVFCTIIKGVQSSGKVAYFLALFPYVIMLGLLIRSVTLEGSIDGILFFVTPKWDQILKPQVWYAAITQCFFSLSVCVGPILTYSSHNNFHHRLDRDVLIATSLDTVTSFLAGCTIFGILGNLAHELQIEDISTVVRSGTGLAFISYPDALSRFTFVPQLFSILFFLMMFVLGTGSAMALFSAASDVVKDIFPALQQWKRVLALSIVGYCMGILYITQGGQWLITLVDYFGGTFVTIITGVLEMTTIFWIYGLDNFLNDIEFMLGIRPGLYWRLCWIFITPTLMIFILLYSIITFAWPTYSQQYFPTYAYTIGWLILSFGITQMFCWIIYTMIKKRQKTFFETVRVAFSPTVNWGPKNISTRIKYREFILEKKSKKKSFKQLFFD